ncbi:MAG: lysoplasmalogenase [Actinobacteria bacterium]|nr:lysoplasmalogenase [Actinomycetota bacterium]MCB9412264.1 lysoplasmalogenase [Actinomycetota bacterium]
MARARTLLLAVAIVASILITGAALTGASWLAWARAPLLMPLIVLVTLLWRPLPGLRVLIPLLAAQVFSWFGDIALASEGDYFVLGVGMFLLAQVSYIATFLGIPGNHLLRQRPVVIVPYAVYLAVMLTLVVPKAGDLALPLVVYGTTLTAMAVFAADTWARVPKPAGLLLLFGSILFVTSDSLIALTKFEVVPDNNPVAAVLIGTYCAAQIMLALGVLRGSPQLR